MTDLVASNYFKCNKDNGSINNSRNKMPTAKNDLWKFDEASHHRFEKCTKEN